MQKKPRQLSITPHAATHSVANNTATLRAGHVLLVAPEITGWKRSGNNLPVPHVDLWRVKTPVGQMCQHSIFVTDATVSTDSAITTHRPTEIHHHHHHHQPRISSRRKS